MCHRMEQLSFASWFSLDEDPSQCDTAMDFLKTALQFTKHQAGVASGKAPGHEEHCVLVRCRRVSATEDGQFKDSLVESVMVEAGL